MVLLPQPIHITQVIQIVLNLLKIYRFLYALGISELSSIFSFQNEQSHSQLNEKGFYHTTLATLLNTLDRIQSSRRNKLSVEMRKDCAAIVDTLLRYGAKCDKDWNGNSVLVYAAKLNIFEIIRLFATYGIDLYELSMIMNHY